MSRNILLIGGTRYFGKDIVELALKAGYHVTVVSRGNVRLDFWNQIEHIACDRTETGDLAAKLGGRTFDVVIDNIAFDSTDVTSTLNILKGKFGHYILTSTVAVYIGARQFRMPLTEDDVVYELDNQPAMPSFPQPTPDQMVSYGSGKIAAEKAVIDQTDVPYTIIRPPNVTGPEDPTGRCQFYIQRLMDGQPLILTNGGVQSIQPVYRRDLARAYMQAMEFDIAKNKIYHIAQERTCRLIDWLHLVAEQLGRDPKFVGISADTLKGAAFKYAEDWTYIGSLTLDTSRIQADLGFTSTPISEWTAETVQWCLDNKQSLKAPGYEQRAREVEFAQRYSDLVASLADASG